MTSGTLVKIYQRFGGTYYLHFQSGGGIQFLRNISAVIPYFTASYSEDLMLLITAKAGSSGRAVEGDGVRPFTCPEESYRLWYVVLCDIETS